MHFITTSRYREAFTLASLLVRFFKEDAYIVTINLPPKQKTPLTSNEPQQTYLSSLFNLPMQLLSQKRPATYSLPKLSAKQPRRTRGPIVSRDFEVGRAETEGRGRERRLEAFSICILRSRRHVGPGGVGETLVMSRTYAYNQ